MAFSSRFHTPPPPRLYHYTTQQAFSAIVASKSLWATDVRYLNDSEEYFYAIKRATDAIRQVAEKASIQGAKELGEGIVAALGNPPERNFYVFSFSEDGDSLNQWRSYTRIGPGYAMGFASDLIQELCFENDLLFGRCIYSKQETDEAISELASSFVAELSQYFPRFGKGEINEDLIVARSTRFVNLFLRYAAFIKNPAFEQEKEWRIVASSKQLPPGRIEFRCGPHSVVPYIVVSCGEVEFLKSLREVVLKPTPHMDLAEQAIRSFIRAHHGRANMPDYESKDFEVRRSIVPYREGA